MSTVKVSPKFQVVIPKEVRESLGIRSGQRVRVVAFEDRVEFIPLKPMRRMRGFLKGLNTNVPREDDRL